MIQADGIANFLYFHWGNIFIGLFFILHLPVLVARLGDQLVQIEPALLEDVTKPLLVPLHQLVVEAEGAQVLPVPHDVVDVLVQQTAPELLVRRLHFPGLLHFWFNQKEEALFFKFNGKKISPKKCQH